MGNAGAIVELNFGPSFEAEVIFYEVGVWSRFLC